MPELKLKKDYEQFEQLMHEEVVPFVYEKSDGTLRHAIGTRCELLIPPSAEKFELYERTLKDIHEIGSADHQLETLNEFFPEKKKAPRNQNPDRVNYYDFNAPGWRNFNKEKFVGYYEIAE